MTTTGLGSILLETSFEAMQQADIDRIERVVMLLKLPSDKVIEVPVPATGVDRPGKLAAVLHEVTARGQYKLGVRLHFAGGTSITSHTVSVFSATDGMA